MKLSGENKDRIIKKIQFVIEKMKVTADMDESLYYLSAIHSIINRIYNIEFNQHLIFMHFMLVNCYNTILKGIAIARQGKQPITIDSKFFNKLIGYWMNYQMPLKKIKQHLKFLRK